VDDANPFGLEAQRDDFALEFCAGFLERTNVSHVSSPCCFRARDHRGLDGDLQAGGDRRRIRLADRNGVEDGGAELSWLARNGRHAQGKKVLRRRCGQTIEAKPPFGQIKP
jgi:hypothetical protein